MNKAAWMQPIVYALGQEDRIFNLPSSGDVVVMYHNVFPRAIPRLHLRNCGVSELRDDIRYFAKRFRIVALDELFTEPSTHRRLAITFDDGLVNNLRYALPVIDELRAPATFFASTPLLRGRSVLWPDHLAMTGYRTGRNITIENIEFRWIPGSGYRDPNGRSVISFLMEKSRDAIDEILNQIERRTGYVPADDVRHEQLYRVMNGEELRIFVSGNYATVGSHGISHLDFTRLSTDELHEELRDSKEYIRRATGKDVKALAYPFGAFNVEVAEQARQAGYQFQLGVQRQAGVISTGDIRFRVGLYNCDSSSARRHRVNESAS